MAAVAATCLVSIFAAQIFFALALVVYLVRLAGGRARVPRLPVDAPILAFCVWTLLSASFSANPVESYESAKKLVLFALLYVAVEVMADERDRERIMDAALLGGLVLGAGSLLQYYLLGFNTPATRPHSFLGHYMTASGLSMGVLVVAAARLSFGRRLALPTRTDFLPLGALLIALLALSALQADDLFAIESERLFVAGLSAAAAALALARGAWPGASAGTLLAALAAPVSAWALVISRTRNAWLGALLGLALVAVLRAPKTLWLLAAALAAVLVVGPAPVMDRLTLRDASSIDRYYMWQAGLDMIRDKPVFGQGPGRILDAYPAYRWPEAPNALTPHMHNNVLQIAAERGLPCLAWWLWFIAALVADAWREARRTGAWSAVAALALLVAILGAGMFEYNLGDSEILMFVLIVCALPYALRHQRTLIAA
jgi:O-antigen ligase